MKYQDPACAYCPPTVRACRQGEAEERGPGFCPTKVDPGSQNVARALYDDPETRKISRESALVESEGYCKWTQVEEIVQFAKDRVLGHNPVVALQLADTYYSRLWGPNKPAKPPKLPPAGRRSPKG